MKIQALNSEKQRAWFYFTRTSFHTLVVTTPSGDTFYLIAEQVEAAISDNVEPKESKQEQE